jgi:hypothetical protein
MSYDEESIERDEDEAQERREEEQNEELDLAAALEPPEAVEAAVDRLIQMVLTAVKMGYFEYPGDPDSHPIEVKMTLGDWRRACRLLEAFKDSGSNFTTDLD